MAAIARHVKSSLTHNFAAYHFFSVLADTFFTSILSSIFYCRQSFFTTQSSIFLSFERHTTTSACHFLRYFRRDFETKSIALLVADQASYLRQARWRLVSTAQRIIILPDRVNVPMIGSNFSRRAFELIPQEIPTWIFGQRLKTIVPLKMIPVLVELDGFQSLRNNGMRFRQIETFRVIDLRNFIDDDMPFRLALKIRHVGECLVGGDDNLPARTCVLEMLGEPDGNVAGPVFVAMKRRDRKRRGPDLVADGGDDELDGFLDDEDFCPVAGKVFRVTGQYPRFTGAADGAQILNKCHNFLWW